jgi:hypothetical protein
MRRNRGSRGRGVGKLVSIQALLAVSLCFAGCGGSGGGNEKTPVGETSCTADAAWVENPVIATEVPNGGDTFCDFHHLAWEDFLALVQPVQGGGAGAGPPPLLFETWMPKAGVFHPSALDPARGDEPYPFGAQLPVPPQCPSSAAGMLLGPFLGQGDAALADENLEAGSNAAPLADRNGNWLHYGILFNETAYDFLTQCQLYKIGCFDTGIASKDIAFPDQSIVLKTAWRIVDESELDVRPPRYYLARALVDPVGPLPEQQKCEEVLVALVGFHIMHKTPLHPEWVWATFEHEDNAPDCTQPSDPPPGYDGWALYDPSCADGTSCTENVFQNPCSTAACTQTQSYACGANLDATCVDVAACGATESCRSCYQKECAMPNVPAQVCRNFPPGWTLVDGDGGDAVPAIDAQYQSLDDSVRAILAADGSVWQHYRLVGTLWCRGADMTAPGNLTCGKEVLTNRQQIGELQLSNSTMESFNQRLNCFSCHNGSFAAADDDFPQADFSHLFADMTTGGECDGTPASCPAH